MGRPHSPNAAAQPIGAWRGPGRGWLARFNFQSRASITYLQKYPVQGDANVVKVGGWGGGGVCNPRRCTATGLHRDGLESSREIKEKQCEAKDGVKLESAVTKLCTGMV